MDQTEVLDILDLLQSTVTEAEVLVRSFSGLVLHCSAAPYEQ